MGMFFELIATIFAGVAGAGLVLIANTLLGGRLPKWLMPVAAGAAMIGMTVYNEYTWFDRQSGGLPDGFEVVLSVENRAWFRPWTYPFPYVHRFVAVDTDTIQTHANHPAQALARLYFFSRWREVEAADALIDCAGRRIAILRGEAPFADDGSVIDPDWGAVPEDDRILTIVCAGGA